jgi:hypothetical protein
MFLGPEVVSCMRVRTPFAPFALASLLAVSPQLRADGCTTQAVMSAATRISLATAAQTFSQKVGASDVDGIRSLTIPQYAQNFEGIRSAINTAAPHLKGAAFVVESVWLLDATGLKPAADGTLQDGQFFCSLNHSAQQVSFLIPSLPAGRYAFAVVDANNVASPWQLAFILQEVAGSWRLAGFFPRATTAGGHDGLWYWQAARDFAAKKQPWNAWIYYQQAVTLLRPVSFMSSSHLDALNEEMSRAAPPALSQGLSADMPLVLRTATGADLRITALGTDDSLNTSPVDLALHFKAEPLNDTAAARARNRAAALALLAAYPELRPNFHGVWVFAEVPGQPPFPSEEPMAGLH